MNRHGERPEEDLLGNSQNLSKAALLSQPAVTMKLSGLFLAGRRWLKPARLDHFRGSGKALGGSRGLTRWAPAVCSGNSGQQTWSCCVRRQ